MKLKYILVYNDKTINYNIYGTAKAFNFLSSIVVGRIILKKKKQKLICKIVFI